MPLTERSGLTPERLLQRREVPETLLGLCACVSPGLCGPRRYRSLSRIDAKEAAAGLSSRVLNDRQHVLVQPSIGYYDLAAKEVDWLIGIIGHATARLTHD